MCMIDSKDNLGQSLSVMSRPSFDAPVFMFRGGSICMLALERYL